MIVAALVFSLQAAPALGPVFDGWYLIGGNPTQLVFAHRASVRGPRSTRTVTSRMIQRSTKSGVASSKFVVSVNCDAGTIAMVSNELFAESGASVGVLEPKLEPKLIRPGTVGADLRPFICDANEPDGAPQVGYLTTLPIETAADHAFRLLGIGLAPEIAYPLSAIDAERAPRSFNDLLNALVPANRQGLVRAIKTPKALAEPRPTSIGAAALASTETEAATYLRLSLSFWRACVEDSTISSMSTKPVHQVLDAAFANCVVQENNYRSAVVEYGKFDEISLSENDLKIAATRLAQEKKDAWRTALSHKIQNDRGVRNIINNYMKQQ